MADELISKKALTDKIASITIMVVGLRAGKGVLGEIMRSYQEQVLNALKSAPAVDAVEVVRCGNCEHGHSCCCVVCEEEQLVLCSVHLAHRSVNAYCDKGERREDDG